MNWALFATAAYIAYGVLAIIAKVGKAREPIDSGTAVISTVTGAAVITVIVLAGLAMT